MRPLAALAALILAAPLAWSAAAATLPGGDAYDKLHDSLVLRQDAAPTFDRTAFRQRLHDSLVAHADPAIRDPFARVGPKAMPVAWSAFAGGSAIDRDAFRDGLVAPVIRSAGVAPPISDAPTTTATSSVVLIKVGRVTVPASLPGVCRVDGTVEEVREGAAFAEGQAMAIPVPCGHQAGPVPPRTEIAAPVDVDALVQAKRGLARVDGSGRLVWEGGAIAVSTHRPGSGPQLAVWGYQVLDRDTTPASPRPRRS